MALEFKRLPRPGDVPGALVTAEQKLWLTAGRDELVADGDERAGGAAGETKVEQARRAVMSSWRTATAEPPFCSACPATKSRGGKRNGTDYWPPRRRSRRWLPGP